MKTLRLLLYPFAMLYGLAVWFRNTLFDIGILRSKSFPVWVISVGNLSVGGTGKSPHIEYLLRLIETISLKNTNVGISLGKTAVLSRGYGRRTSGFLMVTENSLAEDSGDEPLQIKKKFSRVAVAVDEKRTRGVKKVLEADNNINLFLLDDAVQHRYVTPTFSILLTGHNMPFYENHLLPAGTLREQRRGYKRADIIVVTRTPLNLADVEKKIIIKKIAPLANQTIFFSSVVHDEPQPVYSASAPAPKIDKSVSVVLLTGIATPGDLLNYLREQAKEVFHIKYPDHHDFSLVDIMKVADTFKAIENPSKVILTTEKDAMRLHQPALVEHLCKLPLYFIPIHIKMHNEEEFEYQVIRYLNKFQLYRTKKQPNKAV